jgi:deoxycytidine triphosphate deaminase
MGACGMLARPPATVQQRGNPGAAARSLQCSRMSIKSDRWIRRMAAEHGMIEPFEPGQVRHAADGHKIVSYGTSSYGYDIRCAPEFKVFTNIYSTVVDPKNFDERSFVDIEADVCIIPPNSFALARTLEYFRIPRNVLTICLGKCVTGDTRVVDAETGAYVPITEFKWGRKTVGLDNWRLRTAPVSAFMAQGRKPVFTLTTKAGLRIRATANHPLRQLHGWTALEDLRVGDRIAAAREMPVFGKTPIPDWEATLLGLMISEGQCHTPGHSPTFTTGDPALADLLHECVAASGMGEASFNGAYGYRLVNRKGRGGIRERNRFSAWLESYGLTVKADDKFVPQAVFKSPRASTRRFLQALFSGDGGLYSSGDGFFLEYYSNSRRLVEDVHHLLLRFGVFSRIREKRTHLGKLVHRVQITDRAQIRRFAGEIGFCPGSVKQVRLESDILPTMAVRISGGCRSNFDTLPAAAWPMLNVAAARHRVTLGSLGVRSTHPAQSLPYALAAQVAHMTGDADLGPLVDGPVWDVVESIEPSGEEEVFDLTVPGLHNFVANDLVVHNSTYARCGIIVNVTPFEPEWEGYVTLEFSNTTPLPAKIYAGEGCAQVLFFESDEVCETSYKDRGGKYQGQRGVTLPKT